MSHASSSAWPRPVTEDPHDPDVLRRRVDEHDALLAALREEIGELRALVGRGHSEALRRIGELRGDPATSPVPAPSLLAPAPMAPAAMETGADQAVPAALTGFPGTAPISWAEYTRLVTRIRALVRTVVPSDAVVAVVSRGDESLVDLGGRTGWHFPRCDDGRYAGHHPVDGAAAVAHLQELRRRGARFLVFPATALWWLTYYNDLRRYLEDDCRLVVGHDDACLIYALESRETP